MTGLCITTAQALTTKACYVQAANDPNGLLALFVLGLIGLFFVGSLVSVLVCLGRAPLHVRQRNARTARLRRSVRRVR